MKYYHGYTVVAAVFLSRFAGLGTLYSLGLYITGIQNSFDIGTGLASLFPSIVGGISFFAVMLSGPSQDWLAKRNMGVRPTFVFGAFMMGGGSIAASYADQFGLFLFCSVLTAIGLGFTAWSSPGVVSLWFVRRKGMALSVALMGSGLGTFTYVIVTSRLMGAFQSEECGDVDFEMAESCEGWRGAMRSTGIFSLVALLLASIPMSIPKEGQVEKYEQGGEEEPDSGTESAVEDFDDNEKEERRQTEPVDPETDCPEKNGRKSSVSSMESNEEGLGVAEECKKQSTARSEKSARHTMPVVSLPPEAPAAESEGDQSLPRSHRHTTVHNRGTRLTIVDLTVPGAYTEGRAGRASIFDLVPHNDVRIGDGAHESNVQGEVMMINLVAARRSAMAVNVKAHHLSGDRLPALSLSESIRTRTYTCLLIWGLLASFAYDTFFIFIPLSAEVANISSEMGSLALSLTGILLIVGNIVLGIVSDAIGAVRTLQFSMCMCMASMFAWPFCTTGWSLCLIASIYSFFASAFPIKPAIIAEAYGETSKSCIMSLFALLEVTCAPGTLLGPIISGVLTEQQSFTSGAFFMAGTFLVGNLALLLVPTPKKQLDWILDKQAIQRVQRSQRNI